MCRWEALSAAEGWRMCVCVWGGVGVCTGGRELGGGGESLCVWVCGCVCVGGVCAHAEER